MPISPCGRAQLAVHDLVYTVTEGQHLLALARDKCIGLKSVLFADPNDLHRYRHSIKPCSRLFSSIKHIATQLHDDTSQMPFKRVSYISKVLRHCKLRRCCVVGNL